MSRQGRKDFSAVSSLGVATAPDGEFTPITFVPPSESHIFNDEQSNNAPLTTVEEKWKLLSEHMLKNGAWGRLWRVLNKVPKDAACIFDKVESSHDNIKLGDESKTKIYKEFFRIASTNFGELHSWEVEGLFQSDMIAQALGIDELSPLNKQRIIKEAKKKKSGRRSSDENEPYDFESFINFLYEVISLRDSFASKKKTKFTRQFRTYLPIDPDLPAKQVWDIFVVILLVYCSFDVPYSLAFTPDTIGLSWTPYQIWGLCLDCLLFMDIILTFVTAIDNKGFMITSFREIAKQYMRSWLLVDVAGTFPFDYVLQAVLSATMQDGPALQILRVLKLVKMVRLLRTAKFFARLNQLSRSERFSVFANVIAIFKAIFLLTFTAHAMGSVFTMMLQDGPNWLNNYREGELVDSDEYSRYIVALYWATVSLTTMGYGDVVPANTSERLFCIFVALIGGCVFSFCIGSISSLITEVKGTDHAYRSRVQAVAEYLDFRGISQGLKRRIRAHYAHSWMKSGVPYEEEMVLGDLPPEMRNSVLREIGVAAQRDVPILEGLEGECAGYILTRLLLVDFEPGATIYSRGDPASQMFIVVRGTVALLQNSSVLQRSRSLRPVATESSSPWAEDLEKNAAQRGPGDTFGELALFPDVCGTFLRPETAVARTRVTGYALSVGEIGELSSRFPAAMAQLRELCVLRAIECKVLGLLPMPQVQTQVAHSGATRLEIRAIELRRELLRAKETALLGDSVGDDRSEIMRFLVPAVSLASMWPWIADGETGKQANAGGAGSAGWTSVSCVVTGEGQVLCLEHSTEGLKLSHPLSLGFLAIGRSTCVQLNAEEIAGHAAGRGHGLCGYRLTLFPERRAQAVTEAAYGPEVEAGGRVMLLFSSAQHDFDELLQAVAESLGPAAAVEDRPRSKTPQLTGLASQASIVPDAVSSLSESQLPEPTEVVIDHSSVGNCEGDRQTNLQASRIQDESTSRQVSKGEGWDAEMREISRLASENALLKAEVRRLSAIAYPATRSLASLPGTAVNQAGEDSLTSPVRNTEPLLATDQRSTTEKVGVSPTRASPREWAAPHNLQSNIKRRARHGAIDSYSGRGKATLSSPNQIVYRHTALLTQDSTITPAASVSRHDPNLQLDEGSLERLLQPATATSLQSREQLQHNLDQQRHQLMPSTPLLGKQLHPPSVLATPPGVQELEEALRLTAAAIPDLLGSEVGSMQIPPSSSSLSRRRTFPSPSGDLHAVQSDGVPEGHFEARRGRFFGDGGRLEVLTIGDLVNGIRECALTPHRSGNELEDAALAGVGGENPPEERTLLSSRRRTMR